MTTWWCTLSAGMKRLSHISTHSPCGDLSLSSPGCTWFQGCSWALSSSSCQPGMGCTLRKSSKKKIRMIKKNCSDVYGQSSLDPAVCSASGLHFMRVPFLYQHQTWAPSSLWTCHNSNLLYNISLYACIMLTPRDLCRSCGRNCCWTKPKPKSS